MFEKQAVIKEGLTPPSEDAAPDKEAAAPPSYWNCGKRKDKTQELERHLTGDLADRVKDGLKPKP